MALCYELGDGVLASPSSAAFWYLKSARQEHVDAQYKLGCLYEKGLGLDQSLFKAILWYSKAAEQGHKKAKKAAKKARRKWKRLAKKEGLDTTE